MPAHNTPLLLQLVCLVSTPHQEKPNHKHQQLDFDLAQVRLLIIRVSPERSSCLDLFFWYGLILAYKVPLETLLKGKYK